jgi:anti-anti-sigma factor
MANNGIVAGFDDERDESLTIRLQTMAGLEGCLALYLSGSIDTYNSRYFQKRVAKAIEAGFIRLAFQCGGLSRVSSAGIGSFAAFLKAVKTQGGDLALVEIQPKVYEAFRLLGFSRFFAIRNSLEDSVGFFRAGAAGEQPGLFPTVFPCPVCSTKLRALNPGRFRCFECKTILALDNSGQVFLG